MHVKFGRPAAKRKVQLLPGPITPHNENPSLSRSRESSPQTNPRAWPSGEMASGGRTDGRTDGRMEEEKCLYHIDVTMHAQEFLQV